MAQVVALHTMLFQLLFCSVCSMLIIYVFHWLYQSNG